jgi:SSS family solute:Na+ symporter
MPNFHALDVVIVIMYILFVLIVGLYFRKSASKSLENFILGGKRLPWYLAGISMVATTFAADTPLLVTEVVAKDGISGNWIWWHFLIGGILTTFLFARLWRRAGVLTEAEFIELRYSGFQAKILRYFKAGYLGLFINVAIMGWVNWAMLTIVREIFDISYLEGVAVVSVLMGIVIIYSALSGLLGVVYTDVIQFIIAFGGCVILAILVVNSEKIGGISGLKMKLPEGSLNMLPSLGNGIGKTWHIPIVSFLAYTGIMWWSSWYPGAEPGGGGYVAQRMMSAKSEKDSFLATLLFQVLHYCVRPWPWIIVALCTITLYPELSDPEKGVGFVKAMNDFLPSGLKGLLVVSFLGAYMSTISTQLNWGVGLLVNDILVPASDNKMEEKKQVFYSRIGTIILGVLSLWVTQYMVSIKEVWDFVMQCGAGLGFVLIARWLWKRINAWTEIAATITPFIVYLINKYYLSTINPDWGKPVFENPSGFLLAISVTIVVSLIVMFMTSPDTDEKLNTFYNRVKPFGFWKGVEGYTSQRSDLIKLLFSWILTVILAYSLLFVIGDLLLLNYETLLLETLVLLVSGAFLYILNRKTKTFI